MAATGNEFETDQEETPSSSHLLAPQSSSNQQQIDMAEPSGNNEEHLVLQDDVHLDGSPSGSGERRDVQENEREPRLSVVSLSANASAASQSGSQHDILNAFITQSSSVSHTSHNVPQGARGSAAAGRQPRSRAVGGPGSAPHTVSRRQRHDSPGLARKDSKREIPTLGKPMVRSLSKPELHSGSKPKAVSSSVLAPKGREGRAKSALVTNPPILGASSLRPLPSSVPSGLSKGAFATNGKLCPPSGLMKAPALTSSAPSRAATPPDGIKRPIPLAKQLKEVVRRWYKFDKCGRMSIIQAGKHELTQALGVHLRDLRILDTSRTASYASCILCREHALVINLEFIQVIVTCDTALVVNAERVHEPQVQTFIEDLQHRLALAGGALSADPSGDAANSADSPPRSGAAHPPEDNNSNCTHGPHASEHPHEAPRDEQDYSGEDHSGDHHQHDEEAERAATEMAAGMPGSAREALETEVSYELKVLEACLDHTSASMAKEVQEFEADSTAALDALAQRVTAGNLDAVRRVKNRMVRLNTRVETVRTLLEKYLADDADLAELHLSGQKILEEHRREKLRLREERRAERLTRYELKWRRRLEDDPCASEPSSVSNSTFTLSEDDDAWLSRQAEMVLEPYFMSLDSTWSRLQAIGEFIDDTEDYVNITLDSHRNQLIQVDLLLTAATFCIGLVTLIAGLFGMNLFSGLDTSGNGNLGALDYSDLDDLDENEKTSDHTFVLVSVLSCVLSIVLLVAFVLFMRYKQLAFV